MNKKITTFFGVSILFIAALVVTVSFFAYQFLGRGVSQDPTEILFDVNPGQSMTSVTQALESRRLIKNGFLFLQYARWTGMAAKLKRGEYALNAAMTPQEILNVITSGKSVARNFTVPEGKTIFDIAELMEKQGYGTKTEFLSLVTNPEFIKEVLPSASALDKTAAADKAAADKTDKIESLEGYLFPSTYKVTKFDTQKEITVQMVKQFLATWSSLEPLVQSSTYVHGWSRHKILTLASIIEKETGHAEDRGAVASVFHNRLKKSMKLQTDPTVLYGKAVLAGEMPNNITREDLATPTRYNSYTNYGLPPTPISNPGLEALKVTLQPPTTNYLYFVSRNDGTTQFSESLVDHNKAVQDFQVNSKNREGKSWRDLNKKPTESKN